MNEIYAENPLFLNSAAVSKGGAAMTESTIVDELKKGSSEALCALIKQYTPYVSAIVYRIIGYRQEDCEELTADIFISVWNNRQKLREGKVKAYIGEIARNRAYNFLRSKKEALPLDEEILFTGEGPQDYAEKRDSRLALKRALSQLEPQNKELLLRYYFYGQKLKDAAREMNINGSTAKSRLKRSRDELRDILRKEGFEL
ncbi:MAG: sigma-70 family RNA polymerase sigma factor [Firmicutes bacterium]|nr:sigma-70 family RNA polymerase sigma factor [[Eubacterium] siraeum]MCM1487658.1 sigma-70 family RNA polymerase sigma factor [Bacillota bacterium]